MKVTLACVVDNKSFIYGEEWAILNKGDEVNSDGWYVCEVIKTINGSRNNYKILRAIIRADKEVVIDLLKLHFLKVRDVLEYKEYISDDILNDDRFFSWLELQKMGFCMCDVRDSGMRIFLGKVCNRIKQKMLVNIVFKDC